MEDGLIPAANWSSNTILSAKQNLMRNSNLPPPLNFFPHPNETLFSTNIYATKEQEARKDELQMFKGGGSDNDKLELLKALRLSQTRAREADRNLRVLSKDKDVISNLMVQESLRLFAHRQWAKFLELQVKKLERQLKEDDINREKSSKFNNHDEGERSNMKWCAAIALCLAIAGVGFAFSSGISISTTKFLFSFTWFRFC